MSIAKNKWVGQFIVWHRYLGISLCLVFAVWFLSGIVLLFARMPLLSESERLAHLPRLDLTALRLTPEGAFARTGLKSNPLRITVGMIGNRPVYRFLASYGKWLTVFGDDGTFLNHVDPVSSYTVVVSHLAFGTRSLRSINAPRWRRSWNVWISCSQDGPQGSQHLIRFSVGHFALAQGNPWGIGCWLRPVCWGVFLICACSKWRDRCENTGASMKCIRVDAENCTFFVPI